MWHEEGKSNYTFPHRITNFLSIVFPMKCNDTLLFIKFPYKPESLFELSVMFQWPEQILHYPRVNIIKYGIYSGIDKPCVYSGLEIW